MTDTNQAPIKQWTNLQANSLAVVCLLLGIVGGWFIRGSRSVAVNEPGVASSDSTPAKMGASPSSQLSSAAQLKQMADAQAAPMLDQLKSDPANPELLISVGNLYYDAQQYPIAIDYYTRTLKAKPFDASVRTDMATAYWYMGNADLAIAEFNKALTYEPNKPDTLYNLGLVKFKGKQDKAGAVADWKKLLATNPNYKDRAQVEQMIAEAMK